jgi:hypothetical protein
MFISGSSTSSQIYPGFLNRYSMTAIEEDKAELYAGMIRQYHSIIHSKDLILVEKAKIIKLRLYQFCNDMDEEFWKRVASHVPYPLVIKIYKYSKINLII